ncbi:hypothetical protein GSI_05978 [Ganoderma sinense ZZ0214-1]|uniref:T6SS Phospholipase effector Tle1-like catalytic domain-containing protein n=1 Tax=Ganoderma sinense ZZ0214-1 TaxID=1077348 RepID=A0A2G8SBZ4_9APHY|nr:hypothetical protein GSI_05978 [Ganoderma sinense ZZ0214-1]
MSSPRPAMSAPVIAPRPVSQSSSARTSSETAAPSAHPRPMTPSSVHSSSSETGDNDIIPPYHPAAPRTLVLCFDGTGDQFDSDNSNVVKFFSLLKRDDRHEQMVYYQAGIGTYTSPQLVTSAGQAVSKTLDEMVAWNLDAHVMGGYEFLMQNYEAGDKICLFGFSRGAYTARALAGMLHKVGLLPSYNHQQVPFAYKMYTRTDDLGWRQSTAFKKAFSIDVDIDFIGVWDTVCSVGLIPQRLPFTASNTAIRVFRHALSLDERRAKFKANHYNRPSEWEAHQGTHGDMPRPVRRHSTYGGARKSPTKSAHVRTGSHSTSPSRFADLARDAVKASPGHTRESTAMTGTTAVATPIGTVKNAVVAVEREVSETVEKVTEDAVEMVEKASEEVAIVTSESGSKLWKQAMGRFDTFRTFMRRKKGKQLTEEEMEFNKTQLELAGETDVKEVWFAGCHCDVGGGSVLDTEKHSLARIPLRWMIREVFRTGTGIRFHAELLKEIGLDPASLWPHPKPACEFGPGLGHAPQIPPFPPIVVKASATPAAPWISLDPPTPPERSRADVERRVVQVQAIFTDSPPQAAVATAGAAPASPAATAIPPASGPHAHERHVSVSTTRTLVGTTSTAPHNLLHPDPDPSEGPAVDELGEERQDAVCPIYDQLSLKPWWWVLEVVPIEQRRQLANNKWRKYTSLNLGRGRTVPPDTKPFYVHHSVKMREEAKNLPGGPYRPKATWGDLQPVYVD